MRLTDRHFATMRKTEERIERNHFDNEGGAARFTNNWSWRDLLHHPSVKHELVNAMDKAPAGNFNIEFEMERPVGWGSTLPLWEDGVIPLTSLVERKQMALWEALFLRPEVKILARPTHRFYIYGRLRRSSTGTHLDILAMCPGKHLGQLWKDVTTDHEIVFLEFGHPGKPINL